MLTCALAAISVDEFAVRLVRVFGPNNIKTLYDQEISSNKCYSFLLRNRKSSNFG